jgi:hypothetical protein
MKLICRIISKLPEKSCVILLIAGLFFFLLTGISTQVNAQIDPERRTNFELGFEGPLRGNGPLSGYGFLLLNRPHFKKDDLYLRAVVSPYCMLEIIKDNLPARNHAIGIGIGGGFFENNFNEIRDGDYSRGESFWGHGGDITLSYFYHPWKIFGQIPVEGQLRVRSQYAVYERTSDTDSNYRLPEDGFIHSGRAGIRIGGLPPYLLAESALEFSLWHESEYRQKAGTIGLPGQQTEVDHLTQKSWGELSGKVSPLPDQTAGITLSAGITGSTDELSCFKMGSGLPFQNENPLLVHGYYPQEIFARRFFLLNASYSLPVVPGQENVSVQFNWDYALVGYLAGHELPRHSLNGLGADIILKPAKGLTFILGYGYGVDAPRHGGFGGHQVNLLMEWKL